MRSERGQASVEWIALVLLLALGLAALARFAPRADAGHLGAELLNTITCAARGGCEAEQRARAPRDGRAPGRDRAPSGERAPGSERPRGAAGRLVTVPPLLPVVPLVPLVPVAPVAPRTRGHARPRAPAARSPRGPSGRPWLRPPRFGGPLIRRAGRRAGTLWRRSWMFCLGYERVRYSVLHPEIRFPRQTIPLSEDLRIANDCLSPVDLVRDFGSPPQH
jgi:hypothetical protein